MSDAADHERRGTVAEGAGVFAVAHDRDVCRVAGPDAEQFLQGQLSQHVAGLAVSDSAWTFVLQPDGKVHTWCRVTRTGVEAYVLDVDAGFGDALAERLSRFLLRTDAYLEEVDWRCVSVRGGEPDGPTVAPDSFRLPLARTPAETGFDLLGPGIDVPDHLPTGTVDDLDAGRILAGVPAMGRELTDRTIAAEVGDWILDVSVDFTKGCYVGQELVARIDSRGNNVPRRLRGIRTADPVAVGTPVVGEGPETMVTSAVADSAVGPVALAYCSRKVEPGDRVDVGGVDGRVVDLPIDPQAVE